MYDQMPYGGTIADSVDQLSAATSYSELEKHPSHSQQHALSHFFNKNELISRSSQITQELEARLKERRQIIESKIGPFRPRMCQHMDVVEMARDTETWRDKLDLGIGYI